MKKYLLLFAILFSTTTFKAIAQTCEGQHEFELSAGLISGRQVADVFSTFDQDGGGIFENSATLNFFITYRNFITRRLALGFTLGNQNINGYVENGTSSGGVFVTNYKLRNTTLACELMFEYVNMKWFQLYTMAGIGVTDYNYQGLRVSEWFNSTSSARFNCQIDPIAIRAGGRLSFFMELGMGYKGLVNSGLSYRIGKQTAPAKKGGIIKVPLPQ